MTVRNFGASRAVLVLENEALLVVAQGGDHHLARQLEVFLFDGAAEQPGIFDQFNVFRHQLVIGMDPTSRVGSEPDGLFVEQTTPLFGIDEHSTFGERVGVTLDGNNIECIRAMDPVTNGLAAR